MVELLSTQPSVVNIESSLQAGQLRDCGSICDRGEMVFSSPKHSGYLSAPASLLFLGYQEFIPHRLK
jgi:hypothetical protein